MLAQAKNDSQTLTSSLLPTVNSAALLRVTAQSRLPLQLPAKKHSCLGAGNRAGLIMQADNVPGGASIAPTHGADVASATTVLKKRRLEPTPIYDEGAPSKQRRGRTMGCTVNMSHTAGAGICKAGCASYDASGAAPSVCMDAVHQEGPTAATGIAMHGSSEDVAPLPVPEPPQPGEGRIEEWMQNNPDRPRLPGGSGEDVRMHDGDDHVHLPPDVACLSNRPVSCPRIMTRQPWRRKDTQPQNSLVSDWQKPASGDLTKQSPSLTDWLVEQQNGKENKRPPADKPSPLVSQSDLCPSPLLFRCEWQCSFPMQVNPTAFSDVIFVLFAFGSSFVWATACSITEKQEIKIKIQHGDDFVSCLHPTWSNNEFFCIGFHLLATGAIVSRAIYQSRRATSVSWYRSLQEPWHGQWT